jgi:putative FmdB family regulatory protein
MAIYEYECTKCSHRFEILTSKPVDKKERCPKCKAPAKKLISPSAFALKGDGWAESGYSKTKSR